MEDLPNQARAGLIHWLQLRILIICEKGEVAMLWVPDLSLLLRTIPSVSLPSPCCLLCKVKILRGICPPAVETGRCESVPQAGARA